MKFQLNYYNETAGNKSIIETIMRKNLRSIKKYLKSKNVIGVATIYSCSQERVYYYKPK